MPPVQAGTLGSHGSGRFSWPVVRIGLNDFCGAVFWLVGAVDPSDVSHRRATLFLMFGVRYLVILGRRQASNHLFSTGNYESLTPLNSLQQGARVFSEFFYRGSPHTAKPSLGSASNQPSNMLSVPLRQPRSPGRTASMETMTFSWTDPCYAQLWKSDWKRANRWIS